MLRLLVRDDDMPGGPDDIDEKRYSKCKECEPNPIRFEQIFQHVPALNLPRAGFQNRICRVPLNFSNFFKALSHKIAISGDRKIT